MKYAVNLLIIFFICIFNLILVFYFIFNFIMFYLIILCLN